VIVSFDKDFAFPVSAGLITVLSRSFRMLEVGDIVERDVGYNLYAGVITEILTNDVVNVWFFTSVFASYDKTVLTLISKGFRD
jgi:hypothetical protein